MWLILKRMKFRALNALETSKNCRRWIQRLFPSLPNLCLPAWKSWLKRKTPKVLLLNIIDENGQLFREHCWVTINELLEKFIPSKNTIKKIIMFDAKIKNYQTIGPEKQTLTSFKDICLLKQTKGSI